MTDEKIALLMRAFKRLGALATELEGKLIVLEGTSRLFGDFVMIIDELCDMLEEMGLDLGEDEEI